MSDAITRYDWFYDAYGRVESREWGSGRITDWTRDVQGRITTDAAEDDGITMTTASSQFTEYGAPKYVTRTVDGVVESTALRTFDARGRVTRVQQQADGYGFADVQYTRGDDGLVEQVQTPAGTLEYVRSASDRRVNLVRRSGTVLASVTSRDLAGRNTGVSMMTGAYGVASVTRAFDTMGRLSSQTTISGGGDVEGRAYTYDWQGRVESLDANFNGVNTLAIDTEYTLEGWLDRESRQTPNGSGGWHTSVRAHVYDDAGNRLSTTVDGVAEHTWTYAAGNQLDTVDGVATGWNSQGEMTDDRGYAIDRNPDGSEATITDTAAGGAGYDILRDPGGDPIASDDGSATRYQSWGNPEADLPLFYSEPSVGMVEAVVAIEGMELGRVSGGGVFTPVATDGLGSVVMEGNTFVDVPEAFGAGASANIVGMQRHVYAGLESMPLG